MALEEKSERERYILVAAIVIAATEGSWNIYIMDGQAGPPAAAYESNPRVVVTTKNVRG